MISLYSTNLSVNSLIIMDFRRIIEGLFSRYYSCDICPHDCGVDRTADKTGNCGVGGTPLVASYGPHYGEEPELVGRGGSGTIFLGGCNLHCIFCQNFDISQRQTGTATPPGEIAELMLALQGRGCENINFVSPTHFAPPLAEAIVIARDNGLKLPIVWNCGGYESGKTIEALKGLIDVFMPDTKYGPNAPAAELSGAPDYFDRTCEALTEMHRQVGDLVVDKRGVATRGMLIRHLVLPDNLADSEPLLRFIASEISRDTYVNIMAQYYPHYRYKEYDGLDRGVNRSEVRRVKQMAGDLGLHRGF
ncbi:MAG: radical SAM protein [bacterium]|nr:radical SAM protein [bacterium]